MISQIRTHRPTLFYLPQAAWDLSCGMLTTCLLPSHSSPFVLLSFLPGGSRIGVLSLYIHLLPLYIHLTATHTAELLHLVQILSIFPT